MRISTNSGLHSARPNGKPRYNMLDAIDFFHEVGFEAVDVNLCATIYGINPKKVGEPILEGDWRRNITEVKERAEGYGLPTELSHLPFFNYADKTNPDYQYIMDTTYRCLEANVILGTKWTVAHMVPSSADALEYLRPVCEFASARGIGIAVENTPRATTEALLETVDTLTAEGYLAGICYDVGHANYAGLEQAPTLHAIGGRLKMLHVHDNYGKSDMHQAPFCGNINWTEVMQALAEIDYRGDFNYEVNSGNICEEARYEYSRYLISVAKYLIGIYDEKMRELGRRL